MMNGPEKSDPAIVAMKPTNKAGQPAAERSAAEPNAAEPVERRAGTKGNADQQSTHRTQSRASASQALERIRKVATERKKERFTTLFHHIDTDLLEEAFYELAQNAAPGVDRMTWKDYEADIERNLEDLHGRVHRGAYRALPSRRVYIPKPDGRQRPLAVAALEDKIVQRATVAVLNAIYEEDFLGFSYGFRPGRGAHDAMDALVVAIEHRRVNFILDADIRSFFDTVNQDWLIRFVEHRVGDPRVIRLIRKWLKAGVLEDGIVTVSERGTAQGAVISPLLANIYLHYALDLWAERYRRRETTGDMIIVRYADDFIVGFEHEADARRFLDALRQRLAEFALSLHSEKTRLIEFGRFAAANRKRRGLGKPETFDFLGFTFICGKSRRGKLLIKRKSRQGLVAAAEPPRSTTPARLGAHEEARGRLAAATAHPPSVAEPAVRRQTPEVGAVCGKAARTVLCGGRSAMSVPTATGALRAACPRVCSNEQTNPRGHGRLRSATAALAHPTMSLGLSQLLEQAGEPGVAAGG